VLLSLVIVYLFVTIGIGLWAARRVKNTADFAIAGRHLPLYMIITTTFATWFGSELVLGVPPSSSKAVCMRWWKIRLARACA
jgi:Na+/proline symporter